MSAIYLGAVLTGIATTMLGPLMPGFEGRWRLNDSQGGLLLVAQSIASVAAAAAVGLVWRALTIIRGAEPQR